MDEINLYAIGKVYVKRIGSRGVTQLTMEIPSEFHKLATANFDEMMCKLELYHTDNVAPGIYDQLDEPKKEEKPAKEPNGPMCMDCIWLMNNPEFEDWFYEKHRRFLENNYKHGKKHEDVLRDAVCELLGVSSRKEIDGSEQATNAYQNMKHAFMGRNL